MPRPSPQPRCVDCDAVLESFEDADRCTACDTLRSDRRARRAGTALAFVLALACVAALVLLARVARRPPILYGHGSAVEALSVDVAADPAAAEPRHRLAEALLDQGAWDEAESVYDALLDRHPSDAVALMRRGALRFARGDDQGATADLRAGLAHTGAPPWDAWAYLGASEARRGEWAAAAEALAAAVALYPHSPAVRIELARAYEELDRPDAAARELAAGLALDPRRPDAIVLRARLSALRQDAGRPDDPVAGVDGIELPLEPGGGVLVATVGLGDGLEGRLAIDSAASRTTITRSMARSLGLDDAAPVGNESFVTAAGPVALDVFDLDTLDLDGIVLRDVRVAVCDACVGLGMDGLLGLDVLGRFRTTLDPRLRTLRLDPVDATATDPPARPRLTGSLLPHRPSSADWQP